MLRTSEPIKQRHIVNLATVSVMKKTRVQLRQSEKWFLTARQSRFKASEKLSNSALY